MSNGNGPQDPEEGNGTSSHVTATYFGVAAGIAAAFLVIVAVS